MFFAQISQYGDNFSYIIADEATKEAAVVDPSFNADKIKKALKNAGLRLKYIINTHSHSDHTAGNSDLKLALGGQIVAHKVSSTEPDLAVDDGDTLNVGSIDIKVLHTPGHTEDGICLLVGGEKILTGDTLFVGECGRTDLPGGSSRRLYDSLFKKLLLLSDDVEVYPGHDYGSKPSSTIGEERCSNYVLQPRSLEEFIVFMKQP